MTPNEGRQPAPEDGPADTPPEEDCGVDDPAVLRALREYRAAREAGQRPSRRELLARYPEAAGELAACLDALDFVHRAAPRLGLP